jgi:hypothetical protein
VHLAGGNGYEDGEHALRLGYCRSGPCPN